MKVFLRSLLVALVLTNSLFARIIESERMDEILNEVTPQSLVVFDLDNTIMEASQTLGSDQWFDYNISKLKKKGIPADEAVAVTAAAWERINSIGNVNLVEESTPGIIRHIQDSGVPTMGLTARPVSFLEKSLSQLNKLGVPLYRHTVSTKVIQIEDAELAVYKKGLLSVGGNNKGKLLVAFLKEIGLSPKRIIFVDDKLKNVTHVDGALEAIGIPSFAFRYGAADGKVKSFDAHLADFEFGYFEKYGIVLSDYQAKKLMD